MGSRCCSDLALAFMQNGLSQNPEHTFKHHKSSQEFRQMADEYIHAVCESCIILNLATRGGPILAVQVDNETDPWVRLARTPSDREEVM